MSKVWMITGAGRGLGRAFAEEAVKNGDQVIATVRKLSGSDELMKNENVLPVIMDVTNKDEVKAAVQAGVRKFGRIDVLSITPVSAQAEPLKRSLMKNFGI